jgi:hypothetical protein
MDVCVVSLDIQQPNLVGSRRRRKCELHLSYKQESELQAYSWKCRHAMSSGAIETTLPNPGYSRDHRDPKESLALSTTLENWHRVASMASVNLGRTHKNTAFPPFPRRQICPIPTRDLCITELGGMLSSYLHRIRYACIKILSLESLILNVRLQRLLLGRSHPHRHRRRALSSFHTSAALRVESARKQQARDERTAKSSGRLPLPGFKL